MVHQPHRKHQLLSTANSKHTACLGVKYNPQQEQEDRADYYSLWYSDLYYSY